MTFLSNEKHNKQQRKLIDQYPTGFRIVKNNVVLDKNKKSQQFFRYRGYESFDPNDGRSEIRLPKRR